MDIIAAVADEQPSVPTFGPNEDGADEVAAVTPPPPRRRNHRTPLAIVIGLGLVLGSLVTVRMMSRSDDAAAPSQMPPATRPIPDEARLTSPPVEASKPVPAPPETPAPSEQPVPTPPSPAQNHQQTPKVHHRARPGSNAVVVDDHPTDVGSAAEPPAAPAPDVGSGSATHKKKDWDPSDPLFPGGGKP